MQGETARTESRRILSPVSIYSAMDLVGLLEKKTYSSIFPGSGCGGGACLHTTDNDDDLVFNSPYQQYLFYYRDN